MQSTNGWDKTLTGFIWAVVVGFATLCISGFFYLNNQVLAQTAETNKKIDIVDIKRQETRERVARLEECMLSVKSDVTEIKDNVKMILRKVK